MRDFVEGLVEIEEHRESHSFGLGCQCEVGYEEREVGQARPSWKETMLCRVDEIVGEEEGEDFLVDDPLHDFTRDAGKAYWPVVTRVMPLTTFVKGVNKRLQPGFR